LFIIIRLKRIITCLVILIILISVSVNGVVLTNNQPKGDELLIYISIDENKLILYRNKVIDSIYPIATGKPGWPSPIGHWHITEKSHWGKWFGGRWMGLNVPWGKYGIHGTTKESSIGRQASHGCIRMFNKDIKDLYEKVPKGTPVIIENGPYGPFGKGFRDLNPGDRGADVLAVQRKLKLKGYFNGRLNGIYEESLKKAIIKFQKDNNLPVKHTITKEDYKAMGFIEFE